MPVGAVLFFSKFEWTTLIASADSRDRAHSALRVGSRGCSGRD